jgi:hypothetical protein
MGSAASYGRQDLLLTAEETRTQSYCDRYESTVYLLFVVREAN